MAPRATPITKSLFIGIAVFLVLLALVLLNLTERPVMKEQEHNESGIVKRVIDPDTLELANGERVRLLCINAPEREQPWSAAAAGQIRALLEGEEVTLVRDVSDRDVYGRLLRHVYLRNGAWVQDVIVQAGYARIMPYPPDTSRCEALEEARREAERAGQGIWAAKVPICDRDAYDCDDFGSTKQAEALFAACGGPSNDVHRLDSDADGAVCEELA